MVESYKKDLSKFITYAKNFYNLSYSERYAQYRNINEEIFSVKSKFLKDFIIENISTTPTLQLQNILINFSGEVLKCIPFSNKALIYFISTDEINKFVFSKINPLSRSFSILPGREDNNLLSGITLENYFFDDKYKHLAGSIILINNDINEEDIHITKEHELNHASYYFHPNRLHQQFLNDKINGQNLTSSEKEDSIIELYKFYILFELSGILYSLRIYNFQSRYDSEFMDIIQPLSLKVLKILNQISNKKIKKNIVDLTYRDLHEFKLIKNKINRAINYISFLVNLPNPLSHAFLFVSKAMQILTYEEIKTDLVEFCIEYIYPTFKEKYNRIKYF